MTDDRPYPDYVPGAIIDATKAATEAERLRCIRLVEQAPIDSKTKNALLKRIKSGSYP